MSEKIDRYLDLIAEIGGCNFVSSLIQSIKEDLPTHHKRGKRDNYTSTDKIDDLSVYFRRTGRFKVSKELDMLNAYIRAGTHLELFED